MVVPDMCIPPRVATDPSPPRGAGPVLSTPAAGYPNGRPRRGATDPTGRSGDDQAKIR
ncbi:hypothetical protein GCM10009665_69100 [Kitasatospora nipponensis]|uniref:Uncharacterized protein n=1 Tax=Kitasatospora nipponensis TaxID=258049 RepID=A0ABP4HK35_9ACTN